MCAKLWFSHMKDAVFGIFTVELAFRSNRALAVVAAVEPHFDA